MANFPKPGVSRLAWGWSFDFGSHTFSLGHVSGVPEPEFSPAQPPLVAAKGPGPFPDILSPRLGPALYSGHFQKIAALSSSLCPELVLTATATYKVTWRHCSVSTRVVTDVCQAGRSLRAPRCCFLMLADVQGSFLVSVLSNVPPGPLGEESSP